MSQAGRPTKVGGRPRRVSASRLILERGRKPIRRRIQDRNILQLPPDFVRENRDLLIWLIGLWESAHKRKRRGLITPKDGNHEKPRPATAGNSLRKPR